MHKTNILRQTTKEFSEKSIIAFWCFIFKASIFIKKNLLQDIGYEAM